MINTKKPVRRENILSFEQTVEKIKELKSQGKRVGLCHGGFDLLHPGHVLHFEEAKKKCDILIVSITSDRWVKKRKGKYRPIVSEDLRAYMASQIRSVDFAVVTDFERGTQVISEFKPDMYIKGPDFINKNTPGIMEERKAISQAGGEMVYTTEEKLSTSNIIKYVQELQKNKILILLDRDGTLIEDADFIGRNKDWEKEFKIMEVVVRAVNYLQTKYNSVSIVVTNQAGVARKMFSEEVVRAINNKLDSELKKRSVHIDDWQYSPNVDAGWAKKQTYSFDEKYVKEISGRKPSTLLVERALKKLDLKLSDFKKIIMFGDKEDDENLAKNLEAKYLDVKNKSYDQLIDELKLF